MSRKASVGVASAACAAIAGALAVWAKSTYDREEMTQSFYYAMIGYPMWRIDDAAAADAAQAVGTQTILAWVFLAAALALMVAAILVKSDGTPAPATTTAE